MLLGFREATVADAELLEGWLRDQVAAVGAAPDQLVALLGRGVASFRSSRPRTIASTGSSAPRSMLMTKVSAPAS